MKIEEAVRDGHHWGLVVHVRGHAPEERARSVLESMNGQVIATL